MTVNTNLANKTQYQIAFDRIPNLVFNCQRIVIPGPQLGTATFPTPFKIIPLPGTTLSYNSFEMEFLVNNDFSNWIEIFSWMQGLGFPDSFDQYSSLDSSPAGITSDAIVTAFTGQGKPSVRFKFQQMFPVNLSSITFDSSAEDSTLPGTANFEFMNYSVEPVL